MYSFISQRKTSVSISIFIIIFAIINTIKPGFLYTYDGQFRHFGIGQSQTTILPIWFITIILAIFSYLFVLYTLVYLT